MKNYFRGTRRTVLKAKLYRLALFAREIVKNPKAMGAACPSSSGLCKTMAAAVPVHKEGIILELGGGTGAITKAILQRGVAPERLFVIERSPHLCSLLRDRFPGVNIIEGDAAQLSNWITPGTAIAAVVSGLPLRSLPPPVVRAIGEELQKIMPSGCIFIQFTYALPRKSALNIPMQRIKSKIIWKNIPPARVDVSCLA